MLDVISITCERDGRMLFENLSFRVLAGQLLQVTGGNGSGKSTLLRILAGLYHEYSGETKWYGPDEDSLSHELVYLGHASGVQVNLTAEENVTWYMSLAGIDPVRSEIWQVLDEVGLFGFEDVMAGSLSAGQKRRITLARLLLHPGKLWLLDEPFTSIDADGVQVIEHKMEVHLSDGGLIVVATHQPLSVEAETRRVDLDATPGEDQG